MIFLKLDLSHRVRQNDLLRLERKLKNIDLIKNLILQQVKFATWVEGDQKAPFSIATTPRYRVGRYFIPWIATPYPWPVPYNTEC